MDCIGCGVGVTSVCAKTILSISRWTQIRMMPFFISTLPSSISPSFLRHSRTYAGIHTPRYNDAPILFLRPQRENTTMSIETPRGMLTLDDLRQKVESGDIETVLVAFTDLYGRFMGKRFTADFF